MRIFVATLAILLISLELSAQSPMDITVDFEADNAPLQSIIEKLSQQANIDFSYAQGIFPENLALTIDRGDRTVEEILMLAFDGLPLSAKLIGEQIVLFRLDEESGKILKYTISGTVEDAASGERLIGSHIYTPTLEGTSSNDNGFFSITLPSDSILLTFSYIGYEPVSKFFFLSEDFHFNVALKPSVKLTEVIVINPSPVSEISTVGTTGKDLLDEKTMRSLPSMAGEVDYIKALQLLPGVQSGNEGTAGLFVRGGSQDQSLVLLDGIPIYYPSHMFGIFSSFNSATIKKVELIKEGFPARFGGRLSSVLDIKLKDGNQEKVKGEVGFGLIAANFMLEGPLVKDKTTFLVAGRHSYLDVFMKPITRAIKENDGLTGFSAYKFYDVNLKLTHRFSEKDQVNISLFASKDNYHNEEAFSYLTLSQTPITSESEIKMDWSNLAWTATWNHIFNDKVFFKTSILSSRYMLHYNDLEEHFELPENELSILHIGLTNYVSEIRELTGKIEMNWMPGVNHFVRLGASTTRRNFLPGANYAYDYKQSIGTSLDTTFNNIPILTSEFTAFFEDDIRLSKKAKLNAGVHLSGSTVEGKIYGSVQPRMALSYLLHPKVAAKLSFSTMTQYLHLLTNSGFGLPTDLWIPSIGKLRPQTSVQTVGGLSADLGKSWALSADLYYKRMNNVVAYKNESRFFLSSENLDELLSSGKGQSYGVEILLSKSIGQTTGWLGYTLARSERKFEDINDGQTFPYKYDRRHDISLALFHKLNKNIDISAVWVFGTGNAVTIPVREYPLGIPADIDNYPVILYDYEDRNNYRLPDYHRLDLGINFRKTTRWGEQLLNFSIYNAYNRQNPFFISIKVKRDEPQDREFTQTTIFPIIPSLRYNAKF